MSQFEIIEVTCEISAQRGKDGRFTIPEGVRRLLELNDEDDIALVVRSSAGTPLFAGVEKLM